MVKTFYVVLRDTGNTHVSKRHDSVEEATEEASRLVDKEKCAFFVLAAVCRVELETSPITVTKLTE